MVIEINNLSYEYPDGTRALRGITLKIRARRTAILGANGAGKSTLLMHLNGLLEPKGGSVRVNGLEVRKENLFEVRRRVGLVFQDPEDQVFSSSVREDVAFGPRNLGWDEAHVEKKVGGVMRALAISHLAKKIPHHLSAGEKKKVALAGVLAMEPEFIVLDEPTANLDPKNSKMIMRILEQLARAGTSVIIATHDIARVSNWAERVVVMKEGKILAEGGAKILRDKKLLKRAGLG